MSPNLLSVPEFKAQPSRRRTHNTHVCLFCKRRKVRCDKGTPCSACIKYGNPLCEYPPEATSKSSERAAKRPEFGELVLGIDGNRPTQKKNFLNMKEGRPSPSSSVSSSASNSSAPGNFFNTDASLGTNMHSELEYLKSKILLLEHSIAATSRPSCAGNQAGAFKGNSLLQPHTLHTLPASTISLPPLEPSTTTLSDKPPHRIISGNILAPVAPLAIASPVWKNPDPQMIGDMSFMLAYNPCLSDSQYFSFHNSYSPFLTMGATGARHYYPLNWVSLIKIYNSFSPIFAMQRKKILKERQAIMNSDTDLTGPSDRVFFKKLREFVGENGAYSSEQPVTDDSKLAKLRIINLRARAVGLTVYEGNLSSVVNLVDKVRVLLPSRDVIWLLIDRFFERVYPFFPFLDQFELEAHVTKILGSPRRDNLKVDKLNVQNKFEVIYLGLLLLVLRLSYLTLFTNNDARNEANLTSNDPRPEAQQLKFLLNNPIDIDAFDVAQMCLNEIGYPRYSNLPTLQLCLYLKIYNSFAPENGEGADDSNSQRFYSRIIDMALSLGLHREPENFRAKIRDDKTNNLCRKIWWYLVLLDVNGGLINGSPLAIQRSQFDVAPPFYRPGNENIRDTALEQQIIYSLARFDKGYDKIYEVASVISNVRSPLRMSDFCAKLCELEKQIPEVLNEISETINCSEGTVPSIEIANAHWLKIGFSSAFFMVSVNLHFFNHYEKMGKIDLAYFYLKKLLYVSVYNMMPFYEKFVTNGGDIFKNTTDLAITPAFQTLVHKCTIMIHCVLMKARFSIIKCDSSPTHERDLMDNPSYRRRYELLQELLDLCNKCLEIFYRSMRRMTSRYYYCWRYVKAQQKLKAIRNGIEYYTSWCKGKEDYMTLSNDMLEDLNDMLRTSIETAEKNRGDIDLVTCLPNDHNIDGSSQNGLASPSKDFTNVESNDQFTDELWTQMSSMKPTFGSSNDYGDVSQTHSQFDFANTNLMVDDSFFPELNAAGAGFYENLLNDLLASNIEF